MLKNKKAIIFDLDGTLVDSMWVWSDIDLIFLEERGLELPDDYQKKIEGMSFTETALYSIERFKLKETVEELKEIWNHMAMDKYTNEVHFKPGAKKFLSFCKEQNIKMGIATSNSVDLVSAVSKQCNLGTYIEAVTTSCQVAKGKPAPDVYLETARKLNVSPQNCLVFEDVPAGIMAGKNAGMTVCAIEDAFSKEMEQEKRQLADFYITSYLQVLNHTYEKMN